MTPTEERTLDGQMKRHVAEDGAIGCAMIP